MHCAFSGPQKLLFEDIGAAQLVESGELSLDGDEAALSTRAEAFKAGGASPDAP